MSAKKLFPVYLMSLIAVFATACQTETLVTKVDPNTPSSQRTDGVLFSLPETVVVAEVPLTKTDYKPGIFSDWTEFFYPDLTADDYVTEEKSAFKVGAPTFSTRGQTDPKNVYIAHIKAKQFETKTMLLEFNEDGIIAHADVSSKDETIDIITSGVKTAASIVGPLLPIGAGGAAVGGNPSINRVQADSDENYFKKQLSERELALYESLDEDYRKFLGNYFGYPFLIYVARKESRGSTITSAGIEFFFTLNKKQQESVEQEPLGLAPCEALPKFVSDGPPPVSATDNKPKDRKKAKRAIKTKDELAGAVPPAAPPPNCLSTQVRIELVRALAAFGKIQELRQKREELEATDTPAAVTTSTNLELKLKELDAQIKGTEQTYFLGSSSETSATAKFEFKPETGALNQNLFTYAAGGGKPGICNGGVSNETADFKAIWPQKLGGAACHAPGNYSFELNDFRDLKKLAAKLKPPAAGAVRDPVSTFLYAQLAPATKGYLVAPFTTPQTRKRLLTALITDLNAVLTGPSIFPLVSFDQVKLSAASLDLLGKPVLTAAQLIQLNRLLIEDTYLDEIYRQKAWVSHQISLSVDSPPPGFASAVVPVTPLNANALEPGKRGFPYRIAASTLARLLDDDNEKGRSAVKIAQFGPVRTLPAGLGGRRSSYSIVYYDATGAIKTFNMSADALIQKQNVTDLTDAATTLRDSEAAKLKRDTDLLKAKKDKLDAEKALKTAQGEPSPTPTPQ
jgi:hypothetical protein